MERSLYNKYRPENFDEEIGRKIAYQNAVQKIWSLEGYLLKEKLYKESV